MRRAVVPVLASVLVLGAAPARGAVKAADAGSLRALVGASPWSLELRGRHGTLRQHPGTGAGPTGTLGFRRGGAWHHATRIASSRREGRAFVALLETTDPARSIEVRLAPGAEGVIRMVARLAGPSGGVTAMGIGFAARPGERYLGFGERSNAVDQRGNVVENYSAEGAFQPEERPFVPNAFVPPWGFRGRDDATYFPMPWLLSTAGYGVLVDETRTSYFRLGTEDPGAWSLEVAAAPEGAGEAWMAPAVTRLALRFFAGPRPGDVVRRLSAAIGRQPPPEPWYLGSWFQRTGDEEEGDARMLRRRDVPISLYQTYLHYLPCGDQQGIEARQPPRTAALHALGYAVTTYFNPMICTSYSPAYERAAGAGALTLNGAGDPYVYRYNEFTVSQFDFSAATGRGVFRRLLSEAVGDGYDGWMEDFGEYTPLDSRSADGSSGFSMHNRYPRIYHCAVWDWERRLGRPLARYVRSGWTGSARCSPIVWNGDPTTDWGYDGLRSAVQNALSMGLSGVAVWGSDIGGFFALGQRRLRSELLTRWVQFGALSPVMRTQANGFQLPEKSRAQVTDPDQIANYRRYSKLHTQLYPYLRAAVAAYRATGMPVMRHLALHWPGDPRATREETTYLFGPDLLVAPVLDEGDRTRTSFLPRGRWIDLWRSVDYRERSGGLALRRAHVVPGNGTRTVPAPLDEIPLFARPGTLLAMLPPDVDTLAPYGRRARGVVHLEDRAGRMALLAFPRGESAGRFLARGRLLSRFGPGRWRLEIRDTRSRAWKVAAALGLLREPFTPCALRLDGEPVPRGTWAFNPRTRVLKANVRAGRRSVLVASACR